jgi:hypothetical protein
MSQSRLIGSTFGEQFTRGLLVKPFFRGFPKKWLWGIETAKMVNKRFWTKPSITSLCK